MRVSYLQCSRWFCASVILAGALLAAGCGDPNGVGKTVTVTGKVTLDGTALTSGMVTFNPDTASGNTSKFKPFGQIGSDGTYTLTTGTSTGTVKGAPLGKYKVTVSTMTPTMSTDPKAAPPTPVTINAQYLDEAKTPFQLEVSEKAAPGAYDLPLKK
jgi:hypothetical protein